MHRHTPDQARHAIARALWDGTAPAGLPAAQLIERGTLKLFFYAPRGEDRQPVHDQDEVYIVVKGHGTFFCDGDEILPEYTAFGPGDVLFVPAGMPHRFEAFTDDFETWVVMYGPSGGELVDGQRTTSPAPAPRTPNRQSPANSA